MSKNNDSNVTVKGAIDAGFTSYWGDSEKHGKTVDATERGENGRETANLIPEEVSNPEALTDRQRKVIEAAVLNPDATSTALAEKLDMEIQASNLRGILRNKVPGWYNDTFKARGNSKQNGKTMTQNPAEMTVIEAVERLRQATSDEIAEKLDQSRVTAQRKLKTATEKGEIEAHQPVEGYHGKSKVYTLPGNSPVPKGEVEELRSGDGFEKFEDKGQQAPASGDSDDDEEEKSGGLAELFGPMDNDEEGSETSEEEQGMGDELAGIMKSDTSQQERHEEIRTVCEYEAMGDGDAAQLAQYVLERL